MASNSIAHDSIPNFSYSQNETNMSMIELDEYILQYTAYHNLTLKVTRAIGLVSFVISGLIGVLSYILMYLTLCRMTLISRCTLIYHKATVLLELPHMIIMIFHGSLQLILLFDCMPDNYIWNYWSRKLFSGWFVGDSIKLTVCTLSSFLALERFIAVWFGLFFSKINQPKVAFGAIFLSIFVGSTQMWETFSVNSDFDIKLQKYVTLSTEFADSTFYQFTVNFIYTAKIVLSFIIFVFSAFTAIGLRREQNKIWAMSNDGKNEWIMKRRACVLSYILGVTILLDSAAWVIHKSMRRGFVEVSPEYALTKMTFVEAIDNLRQRRVVTITELLQRLAGQLVHSWRFPIYLAFNEPMRNGFKKIFSNGVDSPSTAVRK